MELRYAKVEIKKPSDLKGEYQNFRSKCQAFETFKDVYKESLKRRKGLHKHCFLDSFNY